MKKALLVAVLMYFVGGSVMAQSKILVAYFSWSNNTEAVAKQIARETGGDLFEIKTVKPYPDDYRECLDVATQEQDENARPVLAGKVNDMSQYGIVFLGYPAWWHTMPQACFTFLESYNFTGKTIYPFTTHGGGRWGRSLDDLKKTVPTATIGSGFEISGWRGTPRREGQPNLKDPIRGLSAWISGLKLGH
jgi:flavodoxin